MVCIVWNGEYSEPSLTSLIVWSIPCEGECPREKQTGVVHKVFVSTKLSSHGFHPAHFKCTLESSRSGAKSLLAVPHSYTTYCLSCPKGPHAMRTTGSRGGKCNNFPKEKDQRNEFTETNPNWDAMALSHDRSFEPPFSAMMYPPQHHSSTGRRTQTARFLKISGSHTTPGTPHQSRLYRRSQNPSPK
jgi:hypothetical protein